MDSNRNRDHTGDVDSTSSSGRPGDGSDLTPHVSTESDEGATTTRGAKPATLGKTRSDGRAYVPKYFLNEEMLLADRERARENLKRKKKADITPEDIAKERKTSNRLSEFQSRQRRKKIVDDLKKTAEEQSQHSATQAKQIAELQAELQAVRQENLALRQRIHTNQTQSQLLLPTANSAQGTGFLAQLVKNSAASSQPPPSAAPSQPSSQDALALFQRQLANYPPDQAASILRLLQQILAVTHTQTTDDGSKGSLGPT